ncbi:hypothetical protein EPN90_01985 [Patescibacteria group bacterium]|nr:MAG: hypothetical protein EPN90_01985 [Patescibacteria group bacterium]
MRVEQDNEISSSLQTLERKIDSIAAELSAIRRHFLWERIFGTLKFLIIAVPLVAGGIYLYPIIMKTYAQADAIFKQAQAIGAYLPK